MSQQDIFEDEDVDDPGEFLGTPTEFSGVSAASSIHDSPALPSSQSASSTVVTPSSSQPIPATPSPAPSPSQIIYRCPITPCKTKVLKTLSGYRKHLATQHKVADDSIERYVNIASQPPVVQPAEASTSAAGPQTAFQCPQCNNVLTTEGGFIRHKASHRFKDAAQRRPKAGDFTTALLLETMKKIVSEILQEPYYVNISDPKRSFMEEFQNKCESSEWMIFARCLSDKICLIVCEKHKKLMPLNQYEESQQKLHAFLFKEANMSDLCEKLKSVCNQSISTVIANRLVFRLAQKLFWEVQVWMSKETRSRQSSASTSTAAVEPQEMSDIEKEAFAKNMGEILRSYFKKCLTGNSNALTRSACISDKFIDGQHPIPSTCLLDKEQWFTGDEDGLVPSENAINFFFEVQHVAVASVEGHDIDAVTDQILDNYCAMNFWFHLTSSHFGEEDSLLFMKDMIKTFTRNFCVRRERQKNRAAEKAVAASRVALRQDFNKNLKDRETTVETVS